jgi:hypothetical protein
MRRSLRLDFGLREARAMTMIVATRGRLPLHQAADLRVLSICRGCLSARPRD